MVGCVLTLLSNWNFRENKCLLCDVVAITLWFLTATNIHEQGGKAVNREALGHVVRVIVMAQQRLPVPAMATWTQNNVEPGHPKPLPVLSQKWRPIASGHKMNGHYGTRNLVSAALTSAQSPLRTFLCTHFRQAQTDMNRMTVQQWPSPRELPRSAITVNRSRHALIPRHWFSRYNSTGYCRKIHHPSKPNHARLLSGISSFPQASGFTETDAEGPQNSGPTSSSVRVLISVEFCKGAR